MLFRVIFFAVFLYVASNADAGRILVLFPHTGRSHKMVFEPFLRHLAERGHQLTVVSFFPETNPPVNYTDVSLEGVAALAVENTDLGMFESSHFDYFPGAAVVKSIIRQIHDFEYIAGLGLNVCEKIVNHKRLSDVLKKEYDAVIVENFQSDCVLGLAYAHGVKAPIIAVLSGGFMPWSMERMGGVNNPAYTPVISTGFTSEMNFLERLENTFMNVFFKFWYHYRVLMKEQAMIEKIYGKIADLRDIGRDTSLMLTNTFHSLNGVQITVPGMIEVSGLHLQPSNKTIPKFMERFLNESDHGVVVFSFGTVLKTSSMPKHRQQMFINAFSKLKQRVIWKFEDGGEEGFLVGKNILKVKWLPQYLLMQHHKVVAFIAHGGLLSMTEAIATGKPMLVMPFFGDQYFNAAAAEKAGLAVVTSYTHLTEKKLSKLLDKVLSPEMQASAREASLLWLDRESPSLQSAVYWTERVIRWGRRAALYSSSRRLSALQAALLDVAAFVLAVLTLPALLIYWLLRKLFTRRLNYVPKKDKKQ